MQSRATDILKRGITKEQAELIAEKCAPAAEIANVSQQCAAVLLPIIRSDHSCDEPGLLCFGIFDVSGVHELGYSGYIEIVDEHSETSLCDAAPGHVCLRAGLAAPAVIARVVAATVPTTASAVTTSTVATTETEPTSTGTSDTSSSTPEATSAPTASS